MADHGLTPEEEAALLAMHDRKAKLFERLATGRQKGEHVTIKATTDHTAATAATDKEAAKVQTRRERLAVHEALFWYRNAARRCAAAARHEQREAETAAAPAYQWKPDRPARR